MFCSQIACFTYCLRTCCSLYHWCVVSLSFLHFFILPIKGMAECTWVTERQEEPQPYVYVNHWIVFLLTCSDLQWPKNCLIQRDFGHVGSSLHVSVPLHVSPSKERRESRASSAVNQKHAARGHLLNWLLLQSASLLLLIRLSWLEPASIKVILVCIHSVQPLVNFKQNMLFEML